MSTKREEMESGCLSRAAEDEPLFVLRAKDSLAPGIVRSWASTMMRMVVNPTPAQVRKIDEAFLLADRMERWQTENGCKVPD